MSTKTSRHWRLPLAGIALAAALVLTGCPDSCRGCENCWETACEPRIESFSADPSEFCVQRDEVIQLAWNLDRDGSNGCIKLQSWNADNQQVDIYEEGNDGWCTNDNTSGNQDSGSVTFNPAITFNENIPNPIKVHAVYDKSCPTTGLAVDDPEATIEITVAATCR